MNQLRRRLHQHAEKSGCEWKTREILRNALSLHQGKWIEIDSNCSCMMFYDFHQQKTIMLRAELDGLEIEEKTGLEYSSVDPQVMHACGHDGHMAILCRLSELLSSFKEFCCNVLLVFQSSEESGCGAQGVWNSREFQQFKVDAAVALHCWPDAKQGVFLTKSNVICAGGKEIDVLIQGTASHCASLRKDDALKRGCEFLIESTKDSNDQGFVSFNVMKAGEVRNQVSKCCQLKGTMRFLNESCECALTENLIHRVQSRDVLHFSSGYPVLWNDEKLCECAFLSGAQRLENPLWICDDFAFYAQRIPSIYLLMGIQSKAGLHHSEFDFDDEMIEPAVQFLLVLLNNMTKPKKICQAERDLL